MSWKNDYPSVVLGQDWWDSHKPARKLLNQKFATVLTDDDLSNPDVHYQKGFSIRPRLPASMKSSGSSEVKIDQEGFRVFLELDEFDLGELTVKTFERYVEVHGKHEEKSDQFGLVSREFRRRYMVPKNCDIQALTASFSTDYKLTIKAPVSSFRRPYHFPKGVPVVEREFIPPLMEQVKENLGVAQRVLLEHYSQLLETNLEATPAVDLSKKDSTPVMNLESQEYLKNLENALQETYNMFRVAVMSTKPLAERMAAILNQSEAEPVTITPTEPGAEPVTYASTKPGAEPVTDASTKPGAEPETKKADLVIQQKMEKICEQIMNSKISRLMRTIKPENVIL